MKLLIFSDIHNDWKALERLMAIEADYYFAAGDLVNWARGLDDAGKLLQQRGSKVYVLPGNHESERDTAGLCDRFGLNHFHGQHIKVGNYQVAGLGYSSPTPFHTPGEYTEAELAKRLLPFETLEPLVLICHSPPKGTALDRSGDGQHFGSTAIGDFITRRKPEYFFCGHIHEAAGVQAELGRTKGWNVGKKGHLLEVA